MLVFLRWIFCVFSFSLLIACTPQVRGPHELRVGTISGPETELMEVAKEVAATDYGLKVEIVPFEDYMTPNLALAEGSIDANMFQHEPYLDKMIREKHLKLMAIGKTFIYPMGLYSTKIHQLNELPDQALVGIPNDPSNAARALLLLEKSGLISLKIHDVQQLTLRDVLENPKHLRIKEMNAAQLPRSLEDLSLAAINTNYAVAVHLLPHKDALALESTDSPYANIVVVREGEETQLKFHQLLKALHSTAVQEKAKTLFSEQALPAWPL